MSAIATAKVAQMTGEMDALDERSLMGELIKSTFSFMWAMSLFGVRELTNLATVSQPTEGVIAALDSVSRAAEQTLGGPIENLLKIGDGAQRKMADLLFDTVTLESLTPRRMATLAFEIMQRLADALGFLMPGEDGALQCQEFKNKLQAFQLFEHVDSALGLSQNDPMPLGDMVKKAAQLDPYLALWATEGAGHYYVEMLQEHKEAPQNLLKNDADKGLPENSLVPLHAGMGLSFANRILETVKPNSASADITKALHEFVKFCTDNSKEGFGGAAYESLGLVARNLYPQMIRVVDEHLSEMDEDLVAYFWHGVGRAIYFAPTNFLPYSGSSWRAVDMAAREPPHEAGRLNALAGLAWALTLVNIRQPKIIESLLRHNGKELGESDAFANGVSSSVIVWRDSTGNDDYINTLSQYRPDQSDPHLIELWNRLVRRPCEDALHRYYPVLKERNRLGELFRYQSLEKLAAGLISESGATVRASLTPGMEVAGSSPRL